MKFNEKTIMLAMAQFFEDHPERFSQKAYTRNKSNKSCAIDSNKAYGFCAIGFLRRANIEGLITDQALPIAETVISRKCIDLYGNYVTAVNDSIDGRKKIIIAAREAAQ